MYRMSGIQKMFKGCLIHLVVKGSKYFIYIVKDRKHKTFSRAGAISLQLFFHHSRGQADMHVIWPYFSS